MGLKYILLILSMIAIISYGRCDSVEIERENLDYGSRIIGGTPANISSHPYLVSLQVFTGHGHVHICGGIIISSNDILTAARCCFSSTNSIMRPENIRVVAGVTQWNESMTSGQHRNLFRISVHKNYSPRGNMNNDIAVLRLSVPLNFTANVQSIGLRSGASPTGERCTVSGWGATINGGLGSINLMTVGVPIFDHRTCRSAYGKQVTKNMICAGYAEGGRDSCQGDTGGPLVCNNQLAGIVSYRFRCGEQNFPGVYTEVASYTKWIMKASSANSIKSSLTGAFILIFIIQYITLYYK